MLDPFNGMPIHEQVSGVECSTVHRQDMADHGKIAIKVGHQCIRDWTVVPLGRAVKRGTKLEE